jgi:Fe-S-cluster-containing hydrogenase component 2
MYITVNPRKCPQNHRCPSIAVCPKGAITQEHNFALPVVDKGKCIKCGLCKKRCPRNAFEETEDIT